MPLSEEELRLLEQMERALSEEDPKFASTLRGTSVSRATKSRLIGSGVGFLIGVAVLMTGAVQRMTWLGIVGFVAMLAAAYIGLTAWRGRVEAAAAESAPEWVPEHPSGFSVIEGGRKQKRARPESGRGLMARFEERWEQRRRDRGGDY